MVRSHTHFLVNLDPSNGLRPHLPPLNTGPTPWGTPSQVPSFPFQPFSQQPPQQQQPPYHLENPEQARARFEIESEFVQSLANPHYLNYLAQRGYFKEATFVRYLNYLRYFKQPDYAKTLKYPQALLFLDLLQKAEFREAIASSTNAKFIEDQMLLQWHYYLRKRQRLSQFTTTFAQSPNSKTGVHYKPPSTTERDEEIGSDERSDERMDDE